MGADKGTLTYTTYFVLDEPEAGFREKFMESVRRHAFRDIDIEAGRDRSVGWVLLGDPFNSELEWGAVFQDPYVCLSLREDVIRIPRTVFLAHFEHRMKEFLHDEGRDSLRKGEKSALKEDVLHQLRRRALADIKTYDVVWNTVDRTLRLWTHSARVRESFEEIVRETWGVRLVPQAPYTLVMARSENNEAAVALLEVEPAVLVEGVEA